MAKPEELDPVCPMCGGTLVFTVADIFAEEIGSCPRCAFSGTRPKINKVTAQRAKERSMKAARKMIEEILKGT